ncbi:MAG: MBL fold metallo-hydrolase [Deltaproteobacteria bacterium]|nr:MBL fold metallo-hydrolase [Deltaproteobacteria bacterium]
MGEPQNRTLSGPGPSLGPGLHRLGPGVWITSGRAALVEGPDHLALVDPGDEPWEIVGEEIRRLERKTGKPLGWVLVTHSHPDHVANLDAARRMRPGVRVVAHPAGGLGPHVARVLDEVGPGVRALVTPGHSDRGDDLSFWVPPGILFPGDLVQPKGETWERAFYPSPYPYFRDGDAYLDSLGRLEALPLEVLVTGHREIRPGDRGRAWIRLTRRAIERLAEEAARWEGPPDPVAAGREVFRRLSRERGIPSEAVERRLGGPPGASPFERFDLPGFLWAWRRRL